MKSRLGNPFFIFGLVLAWRVLLFIFTVQPIPFNDAFGYDGAVVNYLHGSGYYNPSFSAVFPIAGHQIFAGYPPLYQGALLVWMKIFGTSVIAAMGLHLAMFAVSSFLTLGIIRRFFPAGVNYAVVALLFFGFTFDDRPEGLAFIFGLAVLWLVVRQISEPGFRAGTAVALLAALLAGLFTSVIVGAYFFGAGFLACVVAWAGRRQALWFAPFIAAALLFWLAVPAIMKFEPLWWAGFMESARQQTVMTNGLHAPQGQDILRLVRTTPVFLVGLAMLPLVIARRKELLPRQAPWLALVAGVFVMGWFLLGVSVTLLASNYVVYAIFTQILLAAGMLALAEKFPPARQKLVRLMLVGCVLLVSIRAVGMTTWGAVCAWKNSYQSTQAVLRTELGQFVTSDRSVLISSAYLYCAADMGVRNPIHSDWYFDHSRWATDGNAPLEGLMKLKPAKLVLTQFDYYRGFADRLTALGQHQDIVEIHVRDFAAARVPDASPALQRVVQQISWAPVVVDLTWLKPPG